MAAGGSSRGFCGITQDEHKKLVESTDQFRESVVRIIKVNEKQEGEGIGTAFFVYNGESKSLFMTCNHNFTEVQSGELIRLYEGEKDYPVSEILQRSDKHDLLLFSVMSVPKRKCLQFSTEQVKEDDRVVILGHVSPTLPVKGELKELLLVNHPAPLTGEVLAQPFQETTNEGHEKIMNTCEATKGVSGAPLLKGDKVIGVHLSADNAWREAVSAKTVLQVLRGWYGPENDKKSTFAELFKIAHDKSCAAPAQC